MSIFYLDYQLQNGDRAAVYPVFESLDITPIVRLRGDPLRHTSFILDVHLGKLEIGLQVERFMFGGGKTELGLKDTHFVQVGVY